MPQPNYQFAKRQRELEKKRKKAEKAQKKAAGPEPAQHQQVRPADGGTPPALQD